MNPIFETRELGKLYIDEVLHFFEQPQVFTCQNSFGHVYLFTYSDYGENYDCWIGVPVSHNRLENVKANILSVYDALKSCEDDRGVVYRVRKSYPNQTCTVEEVAFSNIPEKELPETDAYFPTPIETVKSMMPNTEEDILLLSLANDRHAQVASAYSICKIIMNLQNLANAYASHRKMKDSFDLQFHIDPVSKKLEGVPASFGVAIYPVTSNQALPLLTENPSTVFINYLFSLLEGSTDTKTFDILMNSTNPTVPSYLQKVFSTLLERELSLSLTHFKGKQNLVSVSVPRSSLTTRLRVIKGSPQSEITVETHMGMLLSIGSSRNNFTFASDRLGKHLKGTVDSLLVQRKDLTINTRYEATISIELTRKQYTYSLLNLQRLQN